MALQLKTLTKSQWQSIKKEAGIESTPWFKKADAAVGPAIAKLEKSRAAWKSAKSAKNLMSYFKALEALDKSFQKFLKKKDVTSNVKKKQLADEIIKLQGEITTKLG